MRRFVFDFISVNGEGNQSKDYYDPIMMVIILLSLIPLMFKNPPLYAIFLERVTTGVFILDYGLRLWTADFYMGHGKKSFIQYPFTFLAIIDLISILPALAWANNSLRLLRLVRLVSTFRVFKAFRYSRNIRLITNALKRQRKALSLVAYFAFAYIFVSALMVFNIEPDSFDYFFDAIYWSTTTLTTIGYGDILVKTGLGKMITMVSAFFGIAIVALPAGIITAGYMEEIATSKESD